MEEGKSMKKPELLAPAGNMESLKAAIMAGCDAVYLGGHLFGARSFAGNFSRDELKEAVQYAHLYGVKVYVTTNTLVYEKEVDLFLEYIDFLYHINVDALIIQDLGMMDLVRKIYPDLELHASTQMHIHNMEGVMMAEQLGLKRAVIARETPLSIIRKMKKHSKIELEVFIHGALCVSYSGQCFMSSFIGGRSGNRGTCAQCCRQKYRLVKEENHHKIPIKEGYLLSMKDLNTLEYIGELIESGVDSLKIEGRMKRPEYVYFVVSLYRKAIDSYMKNRQVKIDEKDIKSLKKLFNRMFTKGFLFGEDPKQIVNSYRPNHLGVEVGTVTTTTHDQVTIKLSDDVCINDGIRILGSREDYGCTLNVFYKNHKVVKEAHANDVITLRIKGEVEKGSKVLKTTDIKELEEINKLIQTKRKVKINALCIIKANQPMELHLKEDHYEVHLYSDYLPSEAKTTPTSKERVIEQLKKLGDSIYEYDSLEVEMDDHLFISIKEINELRRKAIDLLDKKRLTRERMGKQTYHIELSDFPICEEKSLLIRSEKAYQEQKKKKWNMIYMEEPLYSKIEDERKVLKLPRVTKAYSKEVKPVLIGELGGLFNRNIFDADFSFHVTNSYTLAFLHSMGARKVTLSYELTKEQIEDLMKDYQNRYHKHPNVELIVYGYLEAMIMKYRLIDSNKNQGSFYLEDRYHNLYPIEEKEDYTIIYHYKKRNDFDENVYYQMGINSLRYQF